MSSIEGAAIAWQHRAKHDSLRNGTPQLNIPSLSVRENNLPSEDDETKPSPTMSRKTRQPFLPRSSSIRSRWDDLAGRVINHEAYANQESGVNRRTDSFRRGTEVVKENDDDENLPSPAEISRENHVNDMNNDYFPPQNFIDNRPEFPWHHSRGHSANAPERIPEPHHNDELANTANKDPSIAATSIHTEEPLLSSLPSNPKAFEMNSLSHDDGEAEASHARKDISGNSRAKSSWQNAIGKTKIAKTAATILNSNGAKRDIETIGKFNHLLPLHIVSAPFFAMAMLIDERGRRAPPILFDALALAITDSELDMSSLRQRYTFRIELRYGEIKWVCKKTLVEFVSLHTTLNFHYLRGLNPRPPPFPSQLYYLYQSMLAATDLNETQRGVRREKVALERRKYLQAYLIQLIKNFKMTVCYDLYEFLEISAMSITKDMGWKGKEGYLENKVNFLQPRLCQGLVARTWDMEWVMLRDSYIAFADSIGSDTPSDVFLFDKNFHVDRRPGHIVAPYTQHHITISNKQRRINLKGVSTRIMDDWMDNLKNIHDNSPWVRNHRFDSFAPVRPEAKIKWYVDGKDYFHAISEAILAAKREIYIEDWWLSPELYLRRPPSQYPDFRLDRLLKRKAEQGVMIYVVVYKEMAAALSLNSAYTKMSLQGLHENIIGTGPLFVDVRFPSYGAS